MKDALAKSGVRFAYLFGSRARSDEHARSDADVAVMPGRRLTLLEQGGLISKLSEALHVEDVDLVLLDEAGLELRGKVVQEGRPIYSRDEPGRVAFEVRTRSEYFDFRHTLREHTQAFIRQVSDHGLSRGRS